MNILIGMETSGVLRNRFAAFGHMVISVDLLPAEDGGVGHIQGDLFETFDQLTAGGLVFDLGIFHPTCTYHTLSAAWAFKDPDFERYPGVGYHMRVKPGTLTGAARRKAREEAEADVRRIWVLPIKRKAVENPRGTLSTRWRKPTQVFQPYEYGDDASKGTCLWLDELPPIVPTRYCPPSRMVCGVCERRNSYEDAFKYGCLFCGAEPAKLKPRWSNQTDANQNNLGPSDDRWKERSRTYPGPADAMAAQWHAHLTRSSS